MRKARQRMTRPPVYRPPMVVRTPLIWFTAALERNNYDSDDQDVLPHLDREWVVGMALTKEPKMLFTPRATISWFASTGAPPAIRMQ